MDDKSFHIRIPKAWARTALVVAATALVVAPLTAVAGHSFNDVPDTNIFHGDIEWLKDADVTRGCNPPANTLFCPTDNVTREQMAAFMNRLANNRVVDAAALQGFDPAEFTFALEPTALDSGVEELILTTPGRSACFAQNLGAPADELTAHYQLWSTPGGVNPEQVNVQVRASAGQSNFQVCLSHQDEGESLPAGTYRTYVLVTYFLGAAGGLSIQDLASDRPATLPR